MLLIKAISIVVKGELAKETVNYDEKTKAYAPICAGSVRFGQVSEAVVCRFSSK